MRRPEEFVRWCVSFLPDTRPVVEVPRSRAEWNRVFAIAARHGVLPFLYEPVSRLEGRAVPAAVLQALRQVCMLTRVHNEQALRMCQSLLIALRLAGISPLVLKGVALLATVYRETPHLRTFADLDALIREPDFPQAHAVLTRLGYQAEHESLHNPEEVYHWPKYLRPDNALTIELHYGLVKADAPFQIPLTELWDRARSVEANGQEMLVCAPEDMILHGALHFSFHKEFLSRPLLQLRDLGQIASRESIDWDRVCQRARQYRAERAVYYALYLARKLLGAPIPRQVLSALRSVIGRWELRVFAQLEEDGTFLTPRRPLRVFLQSTLLQISGYAPPARARFIRELLRHPLRHSHSAKRLLPAEFRVSRAHLGHLWLATRLMYEGAGIAAGLLWQGLQRRHSTPSTSTIEVTRD